MENLTNENKAQEALSAAGNEIAVTEKKLVLPQSTIIAGAIAAVFAVLAIVFFCLWMGEKGANSNNGENGAGSENGGAIIKESEYTSEGLLYETSSNGKYVEIVGYIGSAGKVKIPAEHNGLPVQVISSKAFEGNGTITSVIIPDSVTTVGTAAFSGCTNLKFNIHGNCNYLGSANNPYLVLVKAATQNSSSYEIHNDTKIIAQSALDGCSRLTSIVIPNNVISIGYMAFANCQKLTSIVIPDSVTSMENAAFYLCESLASVTIGNSVKRIGGWAFQGCKSLTSIVIPDSVTSIGERTFSGCESLASIIIPDSVTSIGNYAFYNCKNLASVKIGNSVKSIGKKAFYWCSSLTSVVIPDNVTSIGKQAFYYCESLTSVVIPNSVTSIEEDAFYNCENLASVTIGNSVKSIGNYAFSNCHNLTDVYYTGSEEEWKNISIDYGNYNLTNATIHYNYVPEG